MNIKHNILTIISVILFITNVYCQNETNADSSLVQVLRIGYPSTMVSHVDSRDARVAIELWTNQLIGDLRLTVHTAAYSFPGLLSLVQAINNKEIDLVMLSGLDFLRIKYQVTIEPSLIGTSSYGFARHYVLVSQKDMPHQDLTLFKNKKLVIHTYGKGDDLPRIWLETLLINSGIYSLENLFKEIIEVPNASRAVLSVFFGQADVCLVTKNAFETAAELNPQLAHELKVLYESPGFLDNLVCFREDYDEKMKQLIQDKSLSIHNYPKGEQILTLFQLKCMIPYKDIYISNLENLLKEYYELKERYSEKR